MAEYRFRVFYRKTGYAVFLSNRNLCRMLERILRRTGVPLVFRGGFQPRIKISFGPPLPVYIGGVNEAFDFYLAGGFDAGSFLIDANNAAPEGVVFTSCVPVGMDEPAVSSGDMRAVYRIGKRAALSADDLAEVSGSAGRILKEDGETVDIMVDLRNFKHRKLVELIEKDVAEYIEREIIWEKDEKI